MNKLSKTICAAILLIFATMAQSVQAQDFPSDPDWKVTAYLWAMGLDGSIGIGPIDADIDLSFSDLVSSLNYGGALAIRRDWGRNVLVADLNYYSLSPDDVETPLGGTIGTDLNMPLLSFYYGRKFATSNGHFGLLAGVRYAELDTKLTWKPIPPDVKRTRSASPDFTDFLFGGFYQSSIGEKWNLNLQGDIGVGGSEQDWSAQVFFQRVLQSGNALIIGLRVMDTEFEDTLPNDALFKYDARLAGLTFGFMWD